MRQDVQPPATNNRDNMRLVAAVLLSLFQLSLLLITITPFASSSSSSSSHNHQSRIIMSSSLHYSTYNESVFRASVDAALARVQSILDTTRHPRLAQDDDQHQNYDDKYLLAEFLTNTANAATLNVLQQLGLNDDDPEQLAQVVKWVQEDKKTVTLRFAATDGCSLLKEQEVKIVSPHQYESETTTTTSTTTGGAAAAEEDDKKAASRGVGSLRNLLPGGSSSSSTSSTSKTEKTTTRVTRTVTEYHWKVHVSYKLSIFAGDASSNVDSSKNNVLELESRNVVATIVTVGGGGAILGRRRPTPPIPESTVHSPMDVNLTWLFSTLDHGDSQKQKNAVPKFMIERNDEKTCKTPRRNQQVQDAVDMYGELSLWARQVRDFMVHRLAQTIDAASHQPPTTAMSSTSSDGQGGSDGTSSSTTTGKAVFPLWELEETARSIFVPILPLMENGSVLSDDDANQFLNAQQRSMQQGMEKMQQMYPSPTTKTNSDATSGAGDDHQKIIISSLEATLVLLSHHVQDLCTTYHYSVDYIEEMLRNQLIQAIGKEVQPKDFDQFMKFYYKKLFGARYTPRPFTYAIRQPNRYPDGILSVEDISGTTLTNGRGGNFGSSNNNKVEPVASLVRHVPAVQHHEDGTTSAASIFIPINAATSVEITGDRYIHGWMQHAFQSAPSCMPTGTGDQQYQLAARARQFCSFMIIVGNMAGPDVFQPKEAIILQNKDEVLIPLLTKVLPSAREFRDAIASLSPQQQAFAKAFRSMQLETSVFGVVVVQIKPQLEKLLGLPVGALTKEIQLTQDLMSLFIDYQIPSDLLSFDASSSAATAASLPDGSTGSTEMTMTAKLAAVKSHVKSVMDVLEAAKEKQLIEEERKADMRAEMQFNNTGAVVVGEGAVPFGYSQQQQQQQQQPMRRTEKRRLNLKHHSHTVDLCAERRSATPEVHSNRMMAMTVDSLPLLMDACDTGGFDLTQATNRQATDHGMPQEKMALEKMEKEEGAVEDYTMIPKLLDAKLEAFDTDNSLRPTIIEAGTTWTRKRQENLLTSAQTRTLDSSAIQDETKKAFDLLDALSRSGTLPIDCAELHVMVGVTHCFENDVMGTVIQDNINPIHKVEKSLLMLASTIFREPASALLQHDDGQLQQRLTASFPQLFLEPDHQE